MALDRQRDLSTLSWEQARVVLAEWMRDVGEELRARPYAQRKTVRLTTGAPLTVSTLRRPTTVLVQQAIAVADGLHWAVEPIPEWRPDTNQIGARVLDIGGLPSGTAFDVTFLFLSEAA